ncbi:DAGAT-domain-containing protein [Fragilariopsis cylindrus CCMP1102]|uniref:diacylglycerol O-acyltransferase n=1 Tax=Fragilariopsis cylindrus CCMP1102 TaxID=635003 RepID=A0A1E7FZ15_9STRA|nr:DAGAT-domain-containing protein [Fragilariopsis cylindrus CCMP1102]|eukprot:OEU23401.1 DAGAT-domain-containing protein [Fragilariopsis cylindrus CCMP1102]
MPSTSNNDQLFEGLGQGTKEKFNVILDSFLNFVSSSFDNFAPQSRWELLFMKSKVFAKHWLPELSYLLDHGSWTLSELILLILILLLTCSWYTIRADRIKNTEEFIHGQQDEEQKQKQKQKKQRGEKDTAAMTKKDNANDPNNDKEEKSSSWRPSLPSFESSTTSILNQLTSSLSNVSTIPNIRSLGFSTGTSWERRLQTISMFSCSLAFVMPGSLLCWMTVLHFSVLLPFHVFFVPNDSTDNNDYDYDILPSWYKLKTATICVSIWIYMIHAFLIDTSPITGSRVAWLRNGFVGKLNMNWNWNWWNYACDYLPVVLVKTAELPPTQTVRIGNKVFTTPMKYVLGYHPHGIISVGAFCSFATDSVRTLDLSKESKSKEEETDDATTATTTTKQQRSLRPSALSLLELEGKEKENKQIQSSSSSSNQNNNNNNQQRGFSTLYPNLDRRLVTLPINFTIPFLRDYFLGLGAIDSKKETFRNYLNLDLPIGSTSSSMNSTCKTNPNEGRAMIVVVGGAAESMIAHSNRMELVLQKRRGFVREAIMANANLVPVLGFDTFGIAVPLFTGRSLFFKSLGIMPRRSPVVVVVGRPIPPPTFKQLDGISNKKFHPLIDKTTDEPINNHGKILIEWHTKYVHELEELYNKYKDAKWNQPGKKRQQSMRIVR